MADLPINVLDLGVGVALLISAVLAFTRGFAHEVLSVAGWVGATFATIYGLPYLRPYVRAFISTEIVADLTAGVVIFVFSLVILSLMTRSISKRVRGSALNAVDRSMGFLFGLARGIVLICLIFIVANMMMPLDGGAADGKNDGEKDKRPVWAKNSRSLPLIRQGADLLSALVPTDKTATDGKDKESTIKDKAQDMLQKMTTPYLTNPRSPAPMESRGGPGGGYDKKERKAIDRAIESVQ